METEGEGGGEEESGERGGGRKGGEREVEGGEIGAREWGE